MQIGDYVDVGINTGEKVGLGKIVGVGEKQASVTVERPRGGPFTFGAPRDWFQPVGPDTWKIDMPATTRGQLLLPEEEEGNA